MGLLSRVSTSRSPFISCLKLATGIPFKTTRPDIDAALCHHRRTPVSDQVEIETYTWDVLPERFKSGDIVDYVVRELDYVRDGLSA